MAAKAINGRRGGRWPAGLALVVAVGVVTGVVLSAGSPSPATSASHPGTGSGTATVQRRDLIETDTESGTLSYRNPQTVFNRLSGTITWLPSVGQVIKPGQMLYRVDGSPVILMNGTTPAFRKLAFGVSDGPDVLQLNRDLVKLGFNPDGIAINDTWQGATTAGVDLLQESLGRSQTGTLSLGEIVFLPGVQRITAVDTTLGSTGAGGSGAGASAPANTSTTVPTASPELVSLEVVHPASPGPRAPAGARSRRGPTPRKAGAGKPGRSAGSVSRQEIAALIALLRAETAQLKAERRSAAASGHSPTSAGGHHATSSRGHHATSSGSTSKSSSGSRSAGGAGKSSGSGDASASAILQTTSTQLVVSVGLDATKQSEAMVGEGVMVEMPAGNSVPGRITAVSPVAQSSSNSSSGPSPGGGGGGSGGASATIPVTITLRGHQTGAGLDQAAVSVNFAQARADNVLSVPVTALLATAGGGYAVQEVAAPRQLVPVTIGLFAAGYVQISGAGIYPGLRVTDSQG